MHLHISLGYLYITLGFLCTFNNAFGYHHKCICNFFYTDHDNAIRRDTKTSVQERENINQTGLRTSRSGDRLTFRTLVSLNH